MYRFLGVFQIVVNILTNLFAYIINAIIFASETIKPTTMKKLLIIIAAVLFFSSCKKETNTYDVTFSIKTPFKNGPVLVSKNGHIHTSFVTLIDSTYIYTINGLEEQTLIKFEFSTPVTEGISLGIAIVKYKYGAINVTDTVLFDHSGKAEMTVSVF